MLATVFRLIDDTVITLGLCTLERPCDAKLHATYLFAEWRNYRIVASSPIFKVLSSEISASINKNASRRASRTGVTGSLPVGIGFFHPEESGIATGFSSLNELT